MINLIEASIYRMNKAAASVGNYTANIYRLSSCIEERKDKQVGTSRMKYSGMDQVLFSAEL